MSGFVPYWLIHEPGKEHGIAIVDLDTAITAEAALAAWRASEDYAKWISVGVCLDAIQAEARLITEPLAG